MCCTLACRVRRVVIISDARRPSDIEFFQQGAAAHQWKLLTVRIEAPDAVRTQRGWVFTAGVDDAESECGLDGREWDVVVDNGAELQRLDEYDAVLASFLATPDSDSDGAVRSIHGLPMLTPSDCDCVTMFQATCRHAVSSIVTSRGVSSMKILGH